MDDLSETITITWLDSGPIESLEILMNDAIKNYF